MEEQTRQRNRSSILGSSHKHPVPVGVTTKIVIGQGYGIELTVLEIIRGKEALDRIMAKGITNRLPKDGFEYLLTRIRIGYFCKAKGTSISNSIYQVVENNFVAVSADGGRESEPPSLLQQPQPSLIGTIIPAGESREGWIVLQVPANEKEPLLTFHREHIPTNYVLLHQWRPVWFKLYQYDPMFINSSCTDCCS